MLTAASTIGPRLGRRPFLAGAAAAGLCCGLAPRSARADLPYGGELRFGVFRQGSRIGDHVVRFARDGDLLVAEVAIDLVVRLGFIPVFRYAHRNREVWEGGRLIRLDSTTNDDGRALEVRVRPDFGGLRVEGSSGTMTVPAETLPTSYWRPETVERTLFINTQDGGIEEIAVSARGREAVEAGGRMVEASRYLMDASIDLDIWYADGQWAKLGFTARGSRIDYVRDTPLLVADAR